MEGKCLRSNIFSMYDINYLVECFGNILLVTRYIAPHDTDDGTLLEPN
jgi:hypothetical protein